MNDSNQRAQPARLGLREVIASILAAGIGVQSNHNRERDFRHGSARQYVVAGIVATVLFVGAVYALVQIIVRSAGT